MLEPLLSKPPLVFQHTVQGGHANDQMFVVKYLIQLSWKIFRSHSRRLCLFRSCLFCLSVCCHFGLSLYQFNLIHYCVELRFNIIFPCQLDGWMDGWMDGKKDEPFKRFQSNGYKVIEMSTYAMHVYRHAQFECHSLNIVQDITIKYY